MASLTGCMKKAGAALTAADKSQVLDAARKYRKQGLSSLEAGKRAIEDQIAKVQAEIEAAMAAPAVQATMAEEQNRKPEPVEAPAAQPEPVATHKDPGEPAEPVTQAVVTEAITKAAENKDVPRSTMKREALRLIDEAIARAPSTDEIDAQIRVGQPITRMGKKEISASRTFDDERTVSVEARQTTDGKWKVTDESYDGSGTGAKRRTVLGELVGGPAEARSQMLSLMRRLTSDGRVGQADMVKIKVPGDGTFTILNTREALTDFRKKVEKSPGFSDRATVFVAPRVNGYGMGKEAGSAFGVEDGSGGPKAVVENMVDEGDPQAAVDYAAARGLDVAEVLKGDKTRLGKVAGLTPTAEAVGEFEPEASLPDLIAAYKTAKARERALADAKNVNLSELARAVDATRAARAPLVAKLAEQPALSAMNGNGLRRIVAGSAQKPGQWQLTRFDQNGEPWGDSQYSSQEAAIDDFLREVDIDTLEMGDAEPAAPVVAKQASPQTTRFVTKNDMVGSTVEWQEQVADGAWKRLTTFDTIEAAKESAASQGYDAEAIPRFVSEFSATAKRFLPAVPEPAAPAQPAAASAAPPAQQAEPAPVSSPEGQMNLAYRGSRIASLKAMNDRLRQIAPEQAWADTNIENASNAELERLQNQISAALVEAQRGPAPVNPLRAELEAMSGTELRDLMGRMGLAGKLMTASERVDALLAEDPTEVRAAMQQAEPSAPAEPDYLAELFGTPEQQAAAQAKLTADAEAKKRGMARVRDAIAEQKKRAATEYDEWAGKVYKQNKTQVDLRGDGPSNQASMSIGAINESRRRNAMEALAQEMRALDKLADEVSTDSGAERVQASLSRLYEQATKIAADGTGLFKTADEQFQYMLLDDLKFRGPSGKGNVTSNGLSKAMLAAIKPSAPAPAEPMTLRFPATAAGAVQAFNADDAEQAKAIIAKLRTKDALREVGEGTGFRMQINEGVEAFKKRIGEVADRLTKTAREQSARERVLYDKLMDRAMEYDRAADHAARAKANGVADDSTAYDSFYRPMGGGETEMVRIPEMLERLAADVRSLKDEPDYAKVAAMVREKRPRIFEAADKPTLKERVDAKRNSFTVQRGTADNTMETVTFQRGEYITYRIGEGGRQAFGEIDGISHARREFSVDGLWYPFGFAYKAERPDPAAKPNTEPLSKTVERANKRFGEGLGPADAVSVIEAFKGTMRAVYDGTATVEDYRTAYRKVRDAEATKAELAKLTKEDLIRTFGIMARPDEKKDSLIASAYKSMLRSFALGKQFGPSGYLMTRGGLEAYERQQAEALDAIVENHTAEDLAAFAAEVKAEREAEAAKRAAAVEAIKNPKTLDEYRRFMSYHTRDGKSTTEVRLSMLTPEQRAEFDLMLAEESRGRRKASTDEQRTQVRVAGQTVDGNIIATKHTKKGHDLFVVQLAERVSREDYETLNAGAKKIGGYYSSFRGGGAIPGFQFTTREQAQAFVTLAGGDASAAKEAAQERRDAYADDRSQTAAERLTEMAEAMDAAADESLSRERKANTERRARFAAAAEASAREAKAMAKTMRNVAQALTSGAAKFLDRVRTKTQVELLQTYVANAKGDELRAKYPTYAEQEKRKGQPPTMETADYAVFPEFTAFRSDLASLGRQLQEVDGTKKIGDQIMKVADDVSDAFTAWVKEPGNFLRVGTFSSKSGERAAFPTKEIAERAIARSGYRGKAIPWSIKRGEWTVIMSPSEAVSRGLWTGDGDKRITLSGEFGAELVEKIGRANRRGAKVSVPWQFERAYERRKQLQRMGIETPAEFRAALREFIGLREQAAEADRVKMIERAMVGKAKDGLDFFPTPESVADEMVAAANLELGMRVLEPSAGMGHIADRIRAAGAEPEVVEFASDRRELLEAKGFTVVGQDFMAFTDSDASTRGFTFGDVFRAPDGTLGVLRGSNGMGGSRVGLDPLDENGQPDPRRARWETFSDLEPVEKRGASSGYDRIVMNPPFSDGRDIEHVRHAYTLLKPGGRIVALMGESAFTNQNKRATDFRDWLDSVGGTEEKLPAGSFMDPSLPVNTGANARMVVIDKPGEAAQFSRSRPAVRVEQDENGRGRGQPAAAPRAARGLTAQRLGALVDRITANWANRPDIVVVESMQDSLVHEEVRREDQLQRSRGASGEPKGFFYNGKVYLVGNGLQTEADAVRVLFHETLGHAGLRGAFGQELGRVLDLIAAGRPADMAKMATRYGKDLAKPQERRYVAEEVLAMLAQERPELGIVQRAIAAIRNFLRRLGVQLDLTDSDIIANFILPARGWIERGQGREQGGAVQFSRSGGADIDRAWRDLTNFFKFSDFDTEPATKVTGTMDDFALSREQGKQWAALNVREQSRDDGRTVYSASLEVGSGGFPAGTGAATTMYLQALNIAQKRGMGWQSEGVRSDKALAIYKRLTDAGVPFENEGGSSYVTAEALAGVDLMAVAEKLADGRPMPAFSRSIPDTLRERLNDAHAIRLPAGYLLGDMLKSSGKLSWWHRSIGTMHNLARREPLFKPVFDRVQRFLNDVSFYAAEAANAAPDLLPRLETLSDITKSPLSAEDTQKISAPIFQGTLAWTRDERGQPIKLETAEERASKLTAEQKAQEMFRAGALSEQVLKMWQGLPLEQYEANVESRYASQMLRGGVVWTDLELKSMFSLSDRQIKLYREFRAAVDKSLTHMTLSDMVRLAGADGEAVAERVMQAASVEDAQQLLVQAMDELVAQQPERADVLNDTSAKVIEKARVARDLMARGYAPLMRFGRYTVDVVDADGERIYFGLFETEREANKMARELAAEYPKARLTQGTLSEQQFKMFAGITPETAELFGNMLGLDSTGDKAADQAFQEWLKLAKANRSAMKRLIRRKGTSGFSEDAGRVLASFIYSNARQTSKNLHMGPMSQAVMDIAEEKGRGELLDAAVGLHQYVSNPVEEAQAIRGLLFAQFLGGSIAAAMVNMTQPVMVTAPYLSQWGGIGKAANRMRKALADTLAWETGRKTTGDKALDAAIKKAEEEGTISPQEIYQLMAQAGGSGALQAGDGTTSGNARANAANAMSKLMLAWGKPFSVAEQFNRRATFIAAYRTAVEQGMPDPAAFAKQTIDDTQFVYNKGSRPQWARGAIGSVLFTFKIYSISYVELMSRLIKQGPEGRRAAAYGLAMLVLVAGLQGIPGADDLDDLIDGLAQRLGYNWSTKEKKREILQAAFGDSLSEFLMSGVSGLPGAPIDVSNRLGMGNLLPGTGLLTKKADYGRDLLEVLGPFGSLAKQYATAAGMVAEGELAAGVKAALPIAAQNVVKAADMMAMGMYRDDRGRKVIDTDSTDAVFKAIGFQPRDVARVQEASFQQTRMVAMNKLRESEIAEKWALGIFEQDSDKVREARDELREWNQDNPDSPIRISDSQVLRRVKQMRMSRQERVAATAPAEIRAAVRKELERTQ